MAFSDWKKEKGTAGLVSEADTLADKLASAKPHFVESHAAAAWFWQAQYLDQGQDLYRLNTWPAKAVTRFAADAQARIVTLRKARDYDLSDGLAVWMHTARALSEPRITPAVRAIWQHITAAGLNADSMAQDMIEEAGLPYVAGRRTPDGFAPEE